MLIHQTTPRTAARLLALVAVLAAYSLSAWHLGQQSLWYDEAYVAYVSSLGLVDATSFIAQFDNHPPLYFQIESLWQGTAGTSEYSLRYSSLIFGVAMVPVCWALAQRFWGKAAGVASALVAALAPIYTYYSQEARGYTLVTFLGLLGAYSLVRALHERDNRWWAVHAASLAAAAYTHYSALLILVPLGAYAVLRQLDAWRQGKPPATGPWLGSQAAIVVLYLPWLPTALQQRGREAFFEGAISLTTVAERTLTALTTGDPSGAGQAQWAVAWVILLVMIGLGASLARRRGDGLWGGWGGLFCVLLFLLPLLILYQLTAQRPKFSPRYLLVASPGLFLLVGAGTASLWTWSGQLLRGGRRDRCIAPAVNLAAIGLGALIVFAMGQRGIQSGTLGAKDDWRSVAAYLSASGGAGATIVSAGYAFPALDYYYQPAAELRLPETPILRMADLLDQSVAVTLDDFLADQDTVWLVQWQENVVDPSGTLLRLLNRKGQPAEEAHFGDIHLRRFTLRREKSFQELAQPKVSLRSDFGGLLALDGVDPPPAQLVAGQPIRLTLYWRSLVQLEQSYVVSLRLLDAQGRAWAAEHARAGGYLGPTTRWRPGTTYATELSLTPNEGTPPGAYSVAVGLFSESTLEQLLVRPVSVRNDPWKAPVAQLDLLPPPTPVGFPESRTRGELAGLALLGADLPEPVPAGHAAPLSFLWGASQSSTQDLFMHLRLTRDGQTQGLAVELLSPAYPTSLWRRGDVWRTKHDFWLPPQLNGEYELWVALATSADSPPPQWLPMGSIRVTPRPSNLGRPPTPQVSQPAKFAGGITLLGYDLPTSAASPGGAMELTLYWRADAAQNESWKVFVHLIDAEGRLSGQDDSIPDQGRSPTTSWLPGEYVKDSHRVSVWPETTAGSYHLRVGLYVEATAKRLGVTGDSDAVVSDSVLLETPVTVASR